METVRAAPRDAAPAGRLEAAEGVPHIAVQVRQSEFRRDRTDRHALGGRGGVFPLDFLGSLMGGQLKYFNPTHDLRLLFRN